MQEYKIYPKQFQFDKVMVQKNKCFMIMPFDEKFNCVYATIKETAEKNQVICIRADEMNGSQPIVNKIIKGILESQYIIVDITDAKPNVFYELGIAHSFRDARNILIIKQRDTQYPFDISHLPYQEYDPNNIFRLNSIYNEDCHIREHMADIIGAKVIQQGFYALKTQLMVEENWFTIGSIVEAIGRVATSEDGLPVIEKWIAMNGQRMIEEKQFFLLKHLFHALLLLDSNNGNHADEFLKKYKKYMHENQVGAIN